MSLGGNVHKLMFWMLILFWKYEACFDFILSISRKYPLKLWCDNIILIMPQKTQEVKRCGNWSPNHQLKKFKTTNNFKKDKNTKKFPSLKSWLSLILSLAWTWCRLNCQLGNERIFPLVHTIPLSSYLVKEAWQAQ